MTRGQKRILGHIQHRLYMRAVQERKIPPGDNLDYSRLSCVTQEIAEKIYPEYASKNGAGALWLVRNMDAVLSRYEKELDKCHID